MRPEFEPFFHALANETVSFPKCGVCETFHWYPKLLCPHCGSDQIEWVATSGHAKVFSWTVVRHEFDDKLAFSVPYTVALLEITDAPGVRIVSRITSGEQMIAIGATGLPEFNRTRKDEVLLTYKIE
ncbi:Zn-ribbon domain-containing OB-fold protein [Roseovarius amoyensis]|uniref:Zn-ribbon domain-containing OB-fold protein n=1 Tax=Roseovarius amoyensis TaxID=2211448 RepID=UPI000DBE2B24|nr:OB-fold domain-containing protein [Roseovarius amoyensis]